MSKTLYCIRHGLAVHNVMYAQIGTRAFTEYYDTPLLHEGFVQANELGNNWPDKSKIELVVVSPLLRTLQTCVNIFDTSVVPTIAHDSLLEFPFGGNEYCNLRKERSILERNFPHIMFDIPEFPEWNIERSTSRDLEKRIEKFLEFLQGRSETHIAVVSHSSYLSYFLYDNIDYNNELHHCKPYIYQLN